MQGTIVKDLSKLHTLGSQLGDYLKKLLYSHPQAFSLSSATTIASTLLAATCQTRNLLHYRHLEERTAAEKCLMLMQDYLSRLLDEHPPLANHIANEILSHLSQHPSCFISLTSFLMLARKHPQQFRTCLSLDRLRKLLHRVVTNFQEAGEVKFLKQLGEDAGGDWDTAKDSLQAYLSKKLKPNHPIGPSEDMNISQSKIPPLILPSSKSIQSSRYSAVSRQQRCRGLGQLHQLASAIGEGFIGVQLGCLLARKRTQQVQEFSNNSDYRYRCLEQAQTDRMMSSRLSFMESSSSSQQRTGFQRQAEDTNRRYYKKVLVILANLIHFCLQEELNAPVYSPDKIKPFYLDFFDLAAVGLVEPWKPTSATVSEQGSKEYFWSIDVAVQEIGQVLKKWGERISFLTEKKHLRLLWNRNKKNSPYYFEDQLVGTQLADPFLIQDIKVVRYEHFKMQQRGPKSQWKEESDGMDFVVGEVSLRLRKLFSLCDMANPRFYKYQANLLGLLAHYLQSSFSNTVQYLTIDVLFPMLLLMKRQLLELSHPWLDKIGCSKQVGIIKQFGKKKEKGKGEDRKAKGEQPLIISYPDLFCNYLLVIGSLISNHKHVQRLISTVFIKNIHFMETLQRYVRYLFQEGMHQSIEGVLWFYRRCLEVYNQRKLRNQESKSIKMLFNHLSAFFYPKVGCIAVHLQTHQHLISASPEVNEATVHHHAFLQQLLDFVRQVYYYCHDELAEHLLEEELASFYLKYSLLNFIKLYSFVTVNELANLQNEGAELATKESPHISYHPTINTTYMLHFLKIITSIAINRTPDISKKIKHYRILEFFIREFELEFQVAQNIEKYIKKVTKIIDVPPKSKAPPVVEGKKTKVPGLNLKMTKMKTTVSPVKEERSESQSKKNPKVPSLKLPSRSDRSEGKGKEGVLDGLLSEINQQPKKGFELNLQLTNLQLGGSSESNPIAGSSERNVIYSSERKVRKIYSNKNLHSQAIMLVLSLLLNKGLLDPDYCDQFPITHGKINALYILHHHLNEESNRPVIPILAQAVGRIKPYLAGQRLLKLLSTSFTDLSHYHNWQKISAGAYGVIYSCQTNIEEPREVAIKEMSFPKSIYERCVLHDIFTQITCLQNFLLDERVTTMYNYGVVSNAYIIVMKRYDCSLREWILSQKESLGVKLPQILKMFWEILNIVLLLHQKSVTHYDIKADNILLQLDTAGNPSKVVMADFGQCRIYEHSHQELDMKSRGTECIKSPEMLTLALHLKKEADNYDRRKKIGTTRASDIWSLGCLFYQMLTGDYLYHKPDWVNFYIQVTSPSEELLTHLNLSKLEIFSNSAQLTDFLKTILIRDPQHRPQIKGAIQKFKSLFGDPKEPIVPSKSPLVVQKDLQLLVSKYLEELAKQQEPSRVNKSLSNEIKAKENRIRGGRFVNSYNNSKSNKFMRIMEDIFFCQNINLTQGGYEKMKQLKISHVVTTLDHPLLAKFSTLHVSFQHLSLAQLAFRLAPKISDLLRQVLLLKGRILFINDQTNYATNLVIYTLSYWFRCSVYETWCLINTQILLFPAFTSDLIALSSALKVLNHIEQRVEELPKLQCICGSVTLILKEMVRLKKKTDLSCKCKKKKLQQYANMANGPQCPSTGCQAYLQFVKKRYSISWQSLKWASMSTNNLLSPPFASHKTKDSIRTQILLNGCQPHHNMIQSGSCIKSCRVYSCRLCEMIMLATTEVKDEVLLVMNNMLRRVRQGIMIPNAQESFAKKTPALRFYTLTKLHMTKGPQQ